MHAPAWNRSCPSLSGVAGTNALGGSKLEGSEDARPAASDELRKIAGKLG